MQPVDVSQNVLFRRFATAIAVRAKRKPDLLALNSLPLSYVIVRRS